VVYVCVADSDIGAYHCSMKLANNNILKHVVNVNGTVPRCVTSHALHVHIHYMYMYTYITCTHTLHVHVHIHYMYLYTYITLLIVMMVITD